MEAQPLLVDFCRGWPAFDIDPADDSLKRIGD